MLINETWVNQTGNYIIGESGIYESASDTPGELYRVLRQEYGRCTGRVYVGDCKPIGWVFVKAAKYEDTGERFIQETWVSLHDAPDTVTRERHYHELGR